MQGAGRGPLSCARPPAGKERTCATPAPARAKKPPIEMLSREEPIRRRAYELYLRRGNQAGWEIDDWLQAEEEVLSALRKPFPMARRIARNSAMRLTTE